MFQLTKDLLLAWLFKLSAIIAVGILALIIIFLVAGSLPALGAIGWLRFLNDPSWYPAENAVDGTFGMLPMFIGTLLVTLGSIIIAAPLGILSALFCYQYSDKIRSKIYYRAIELLAGIPSVVFGFWGLVSLVPLIRMIQAPGQSLLAGMIVLSLMILPSVTLVSLHSLKSVPPEWKNGAACLGLHPWSQLLNVTLPAARNGIFTGIILALTRAIGETMAVLMVCGNIVAVPKSIFAPLRTLSANIALEMGYSLGDHRSALFACGLAMMAAITFLILCSGFIDKRRLDA